MLVAAIMALALTSCGQGSTPPVTIYGPPITVATNLPTPIPNSPDLADVIEVSVSGTPGTYLVSVTLASPDTGCDSYADWWEVISQGGELLYRRVLLHSHVDEQPFTRSGGPIDIQPSDTVIVRAHMSTTGYGGTALQRTAADGFSPADVSAEFAASLENQAPLPHDCDF